MSLTLIHTTWIILASSSCLSITFTSTECRIIGIIQCVVFSDWLLQPLASHVLNQSVLEYMCNRFRIHNLYPCGKQLYQLEYGAPAVPLAIILTDSTYSKLVR